VLDRRLPAFVQGLPLTAAALSYADALHATQRRPVDGAPFILHPLEVASLLYYAGASDQVVAAGVLHSESQLGRCGDAPLAQQGSPPAALGGLGCK
jgi:(p)ppGpp synthase/HD superfamily hydrolase